jgi:hypothetical protein
MMMFRVFFWRLLCWLALLGALLQLVGFFLPYSLTVNPATHATADAVSYWSPLGLMSPFVLAFIVVPLIQACRELITRPRSFSRGRLLGLIFALFVCVEYVFWSYISVILASVCIAVDANNPRECGVTGELGAGFWFSLLGSLTSAICFFALLMLGWHWWRNVLHWQEPEAPR